MNWLNGSLLITTFVVTFVVAIDSVVTTSVHGSDDVALRFIEEAPLAWREYDSSSASTELRYEGSIEWPDVGVERTQLRIIRGAGRKESIYEYRVMAPDATNAGVYGSNRSYCFMLRRDAPDSSLSIRDVTECPSSDAALAVARAQQVMGRLRMLRNVDLLDLVNSPEFSVTAARESVEDGHELVELDFRYQRENPTREELIRGIYREGTILFAPKLSWAVLRARVAVEDRDSAVGVIEFDRRVEVVSGVPRLVESHDRAFDPAGKLAYSGDERYEWSEFEGGEYAFTLSAYGFSEPAAPKANRARLIVLVACTAWLVVCAILLALRRERSQS